MENSYIFLASEINGWLLIVLLNDEDRMLSSGTTQKYVFRHYFRHQRLKRGVIATVIQPLTLSIQSHREPNSQFSWHTSLKASLERD